MPSTRRLLTLFGRSSPSVRHRRYATQPITTAGRSDSCGIPMKPTWSVYELLSSYPKPVMSPATLRHIHELSALLPPEEGTPEHEKLREELEDLVKLVEAVRLVNTDGVPTTGRHHDEDWDKVDVGSSADEQMGQSLLQHASHTAGGFYIVNTDRKH